MNTFHTTNQAQKSEHHCSYFKNTSCNKKKP